MAEATGRYRQVSGAVALGAFLGLRVLAPVLGDRLLAFLEVAFVLIPLVYGLRGRTKFARSIGLGALAFALLHLWTTRFQTLFFGLPRALYETVLIAQLSWTWGAVPWVALLYFLGIAAAAAHVALSMAGQRRLAIVVGVLLFGLGVLGVVALATGTRLPPGSDDDSGAAKCGPSR